MNPEILKCMMVNENLYLYIIRYEEFGVFVELSSKIINEYKNGTTIYKLIKNIRHHPELDLFHYCSNKNNNKEELDYLYGESKKYFRVIEFFVKEYMGERA